MHNKARHLTPFPLFDFVVAATLPQNAQLQSRSCLRRYMDKVIHLIEFLRREFIKCLKL